MKPFHSQEPSPAKPTSNTLQVNPPPGEEAPSSAQTSASHQTLSGATVSNRNYNSVKQILQRFCGLCLTTDGKKNRYGVESVVWSGGCGEWSGGCVVEWRVWSGVDDVECCG